MTSKFSSGEAPGVLPVADVAVNIFAKPFQTALSLLSLLGTSAAHVGVIYLQFEPCGSRYDTVSPYLIARYLQELYGSRCQVFQPDYWLDLEAADLSRLDDPAYRMGIRYQYAFEHSRAQRLFLMHNDVFFFRDVLGQMLKMQGDAFAIGQLGQCWNCPAGNGELVREVMDREPCSPECYAGFRPTGEQLWQLYRLARQRGVFVRPYDEAFTGTFDEEPWPLPECRINEWACLINMESTRSHTMPFGPALPPGAYRRCGSVCLDIGVDWFRSMHRLGLHARHFDLNKSMRHWVGTGKVRAALYIEAENNARRLLSRHFPEYMRWLERATGQLFG